MEMNNEIKIEITEINKNENENENNLNYFPILTLNNLKIELNKKRNQENNNYIIYLNIFQLTSLILPLLFMSIFIIILVYYFNLKECSNIFILNHFILFYNNYKNNETKNNDNSHNDNTNTCCYNCIEIYYDVIILIIIVILITYLFMFIFLNKKKILLYLLCSLAFNIPSTLLTFVIIIKFSNILMIPIDYFTLFIILWNVFICIPFIILNEDLNCNLLRNICILYTSISISWLIFSLNELTILLFIILMILWDIFAVYHPYGPISIIMSQRQHWIYMSESYIEIPNGLSYITSNYQLGTGDIIFLGVIIGRGSMTRQVYTIISCIQSILMGYIIACLHSIIVKRTVPALPSALFIGVLIYIICRLINPQHLITLVLQQGLYV